MNKISVARLTRISLIASLTLNLLLGVALIAKVASSEPRPNVLNAYQEAYKQAQASCKEADVTMVDCTQLKLSDEAYKPVYGGDNRVWFLNFRADNMANKVRWSARIILDEKSKLVNISTYIDHCKQIDGDDCQL